MSKKSHSIFFFCIKFHPPFVSFCTNNSNYVIFHNFEPSFLLLFSAFLWMIPKNWSDEDSFRMWCGFYFFCGNFILIYSAESKFFHCVEAMERETVDTIVLATQHLKNKKQNEHTSKPQNLNLKHWIEFIYKLNDWLTFTRAPFWLIPLNSCASSEHISNSIVFFRSVRAVNELRKKNSQHIHACIGAIVSSYGNYVNGGKTIWNKWTSEVE